MAKSDVPPPPSPDDLASAGDATIDGRAHRELRRYWCNECGETSKLIDTDDLDAEHEQGTMSGCENCGRHTAHIPSRGRPLSFYRWRDAKEIKGDYRWSEDLRDDDGGEADA